MEEHMTVREFQGIDINSQGRLSSKFLGIGSTFKELSKYVATFEGSFPYLMVSIQHLRGNS
jgi:hypothetical protein